MAQRPAGGPAATEDVEPPEDVTPPDTLALAAGFPPADREQWRELVEGVLRKTGRTDLPEPVEDALRALLGDGVEIAALYDAQDAAGLGRAVGVPGLPPFVRGRRPGRGKLTGWDVRARHAHPDVDVTRAAIAADLDNGVTSLWLVLGAGAIPVRSIPDVLAGVLLDAAPVVLQAGPATSDAADAFFAVVAQAAVDAGEVVGNLGADPYGEALRSGTDPDLSSAVTLAGRYRPDHPGMRAIVVDATVVHDAGGGVVEELGYSLAAGVGYLRALTEGGLDVDSAFGTLDFRYSAGSDQFLTIAAMRAARRLWNRVGDVSGAAPAARGQRQHAVTSSVMMARRDPWVNMLRSTVACFAAGVGGAEAITVLPFDSALGRPDAFARRIARNTQTLLMEEGHLARVLDPAGGSWYLEALTDQLAAAAWDWFTELERGGGLASAMSDGVLAERIASVWAARRDRLAHRIEPIVGVSDFPNLTERLPVRELDPDEPAVDAQPTLPVVRAAEDFEALRDRVDSMAAARGTRPAVFLARLGSIAESATRAAFAANLFQVAGLQTPGGGGSDGGDRRDGAIVAAFTEAGTNVVCLCGTDEAYGLRAEALTAALRRAGATQVWQSGTADPGGLRPNRHDSGSADPGGLRPNGQDSGSADELGRVDGYLFAGCDAVAVLGAVLGALGVANEGGGRA